MKKILYLLPLIMLFLSNNVLAGEIGIEFVFSDPPKSYTEYTLKKTKTSMPNAGIENITVSETKNIAIAFRDGTILVYDQSGKMVNLFSFENDGSFIINYSQNQPDNLEILMSRGSVVYVVNESGKLLDVKSWESESNRGKWWECTKKTILVDNETYQISHAVSWPFFWEAGSEVSKIDEHNNKIIIYSNKEYPYFVAINTILTILGVVIVLIIMLRCGFKKSK